MSFSLSKKGTTEEVRTWLEEQKDSYAVSVNAKEEELKNAELHGQLFDRAKESLNLEIDTVEEDHSDYTDYIAVNFYGTAYKDSTAYGVSVNVLPKPQTEAAKEAKEEGIENEEKDSKEA